jgi:O-antigen ligase
VPALRWLALGALTVCLAGSVVAASRVEDRGGPDPAGGAGRLASAESNRYAYWKVALRSFADHPVLGAGSGSFAAEWLRERPFREPVRDAHSLPLETAAELGLAGLLGLGLLVAGAVAALREDLRRRGTAAAGAAAALAAFALHASLDWDWEMPALTLAALLLVSAAAAGAPARTPRAGPS